MSAEKTEGPQAPGDERVEEIGKRVAGINAHHSRMAITPPLDEVTLVRDCETLLSLFAAAPTPVPEMQFIAEIAAAQAPRVEADALADNLHNQWSEIVKCHGVHNGLYDVFCKALSYIRAPSPSPTPAQIDAAATRVWEIMSRKGPVEPGTDHERIVRVLTALVTTPAPTKAEVTREEIAGVLFDRTFGGTSDPTLTEALESLCLSQADAVMALLRDKGRVK